MSRPEHPGVPLPAECIRDLRMRQDLYDADPERYERREREAEEMRQQEEYYERQEYERQEQEREDISINAHCDNNDLPF